MKKKLFFLFALLLPMLASADAVEIDGIYYNLDSEAKTAEVTSKPDRYKDDVIIPETVRYNETIYNVNTIGWAAFQNCSGLTSVTIPNSVTFIDNGAFYDCSGLTSVTIPNSVTSIGEAAFEGCNGLTSVTIPNSVTEIGDYAFWGCTSLTSITIPSSVTSIGKYSFFDCSGLKSIAVENGNPVYDSRESCKALIKTSDNELILGCMNSTIPNSVTRIGQAAFQNCKRLLSVRIPNSVVSVGQNAFYGCSGLTSVTIPNSVTSIGEAAFEGCNGLTSVTIPNSVTSIGEYVFYNCSGLTSVTIPNSVTRIGLCAFAYCSGLTSVTIPNSVTFIDNHAFQFCSGLTSITIGSGTITIGDQVFACCPELTDVYCYAVRVPYTYADSYSNSFKDSSIEYATLHVPAASVSAYQATKPWKNFKEIVALADQMAYHPLLEEGKEWICHTQNPYNGQVYDFRYYVGKEVERHGHVYRELIMENYGNYGRTERCAYLREEGQKVYVDYLGHKVLLYDFGMKVGDRIQGFASHTELGSFNMLEVISEDTIEVGGVKRRRLGLAECSSPDDTPTEAKGYWVEGIGSSLSPVCTAGWSPVADPIVVTSCRLNGNELISASDFGRLIESPYPLETSLPYRPMFEEGKRWAKRINYHHEERENRQTIIRTWEEDKDLSYVVRGDTVIEDETWKKVYYETEDTTYLVGWGMDKDRNVWFYDTREKKTIHLYDFNLMKYNHVFPDEKGSFLDRVEAVECRGNMLNAYYLSDRLMQPNNWIACVEGVGFRMGLLPYELDYILTQWEGDIYTIITPRYIGCYEGDECIFSLANFTDLSATDGIESTTIVAARPRMDGHTYDLQGRRMAEGRPLQPGIYVKDGRKFVVK